MPPRNKAQSEFIKQRVRKYFAQLLSEKGASKSKIAAMLDVSASRVSEWRRGERVMMPRTAFKLGERLRADGWPTSGIEFLWATGAWTEILGLIKIMALRPTISESALKLYCWLPGRMLAFERSLIGDRLREKFGVEMSTELAADLIFEWYLDGSADLDGKSQDIRRLKNFVERDPGAREIYRYFSDDRASRAHDVQVELDAECTGVEFHKALQLTWQEQLRATPRPNEKHLGSAAEVNLLELHLLDGIIEATWRIDGHVFPSFVIPKIWRMCAGWFYEIGDSGPSYYFPVLPGNFLTTADDLLRDREVFAIEQARRSKAGPAPYSAN